MDNRNKQQKPKKKGSGLWAFVILALIAFFNTADFDELSYRISRFFRTGRLSPDSAVFVIAAAVILAVVLLLVTLARANAGETYLGAMRRNLAALAEALK